MNKLFKCPVTRFSWARVVALYTLLIMTAMPHAWAENRGAQIFETQCASRHGNEGNEGNCIFLKTPILHGQEVKDRSAYIARSLMALRHGARIDQMMMSMNSIGSGLTEEDIELVARYLAGKTSGILISRSIMVGRDSKVWYHG